MSEPHTSKSSLKDAAQHVFVGVGSGVAGTVYGTIVVMATLTAAYATEKHPWNLAGIVLSASLVLWLAHVYAHGLSESIELGRRVNPKEIAAIIRRERGILLAAAAPVAFLLVGAAGLLKETVSIWIALGVGLLTLFAEGVRFSRIEHLRPLAAAVAIGINVALGLAVVAMKVELTH